MILKIELVKKNKVTCMQYVFYYTNRKMKKKFMAIEIRYADIDVNFFVKMGILH